MTAALGKSLLDKLGIAAEDVEVVARAPAPKSAVAHGLAGPLPTVRDLSETFSDLFDPEVAKNLDLPFLLTKHSVNAGVVRVEEAPAPLELAGHVEVVEDCVLLDGRGERQAACAIEAAGDLFLIEVGPQGVAVSRHRIPTTWTPLPDRFEVPPPAVTALLAGRACEPWLRERAEALAATPTLVDRAAAVGVLVRLWEPLPDDREAIFAGEAVDPSVPATAWIRALGDSRAALVHLSIQRAATLREAFDTLPGLDVDPSDGDVIELLLERDVLESVRVILSFAGEGLSLARALVLTDEIAATAWSAIAPSDRLRNEPLLRAVFRCEPDAFWGRVAEA